MTNSELEEEIYETYAEPTMNLQCSKDLTFFLLIQSKFQIFLLTLQSKAYMLTMATM